MYNVGIAELQVALAIPSQSERSNLSQEAVDIESTPIRRWLVISAALILLLAVVGLLFVSEDTADINLSNTPASPPLVSVITVSATTARAEVTVFAEVRPRWDARLRSAITGRIVRVHDGAIVGELVQKGELLFSVEKAQYETAVAEAEMELEQSKLDLLRAKNGVHLARKQFARDEIDPPTELAIRIPQLRIAEKALSAAERRLAAAQKALADTEITAPFSGFVVERLASLGQMLNQGDPLVHLSDNRQFELIASLNEANWKLLDHPISNQNAGLSHRDGTFLGTARIRSAGGYLDRDTRQMRVFLDIQDSAGQVLGGDFVRVSFRGRELPNTLVLPASALARTGHIWLVNGDNRLKRIAPEVLFISDGTISIAAPDAKGSWRVALTPLSSFLPGLEVTPRPAEA